MRMGNETAMNPAGNSGGARNGFTAGIMLAGTVGLLALPSAVLAFTARFEPAPNAAASASPIDPIDSEAAPSGLSRPIALRSLAEGQLFPFTPAGTPNRPDRSVTVAVRVNPETAKAISVQRQNAIAQGAGENALLRIAPTEFSLGVSKGYKNFTQNLVQPSSDGANALPDLGNFSIAPGAKDSDSRFSPRIVLDQAKGAGRAPRTFAGESDDRVDVGGSYRVTDNLDVTAGVRYSQERERLLPPVTDGKQDSQAVYVGTQFRF